MTRSQSIRLGSRRRGVDCFLLRRKRQPRRSRCQTRPGHGRPNPVHEFGHVVRQIGQPHCHLGAEQWGPTERGGIHAMENKWQHFILATYGTPQNQGRGLAFVAMRFAMPLPKSVWPRPNMCGRQKHVTLPAFDAGCVNGHESERDTIRGNSPCTLGCRALGVRKVSMDRYVVGIWHYAGYEYGSNAGGGDGFGFVCRDRLPRSFGVRDFA